MIVSERAVVSEGTAEDNITLDTRYSSYDLTEGNKSSVTPLKCRAPSWTNLLLCAVILCVALLLAFPLLVFYLPRDDKPSVRVYIFYVLV